MHYPFIIQIFTQEGELLDVWRHFGRPNRLGFSRGLADRISGCCTAAPSVLKFDREGNLLDAWGGPQDPGFLENNCREEDGCFWPGRANAPIRKHSAVSAVLSRIFLLPPIRPAALRYRRHFPHLHR